MIKTPSSIRVLHLFSNGKWTGPAEPAVNLCRILHNLGVSVSFACTPKTGSGFNRVEAEVRGFGMEPLSFMRLSKHRNPFTNWLDVRALRRYLRTAPYDLVHCHLDNDTEIALRAVTGFGIPVVRSSYEGMGFSPTCRHRGFLQKCRAVIEPSRMALENDARILGADSGRLFVVNTAIDGERFNPERQFPDMRASRGFSQDDFLLGIVARIQGHRHYEDLFAAFAKFAAEVPGAHLVVVGRGTRQEQLAFRPVRELDLENRVHFTGYLTADEYVGMLAAFDAGVFLTPGTDGTCRAVREIMAMGKPMITSNRGMLAEIVTHERNGIVTDGSPEQLLEAMRFFQSSRERLLAYGRNARETACSSFSLKQYGEAVLEIYRRVLA